MELCQRVVERLLARHHRDPVLVPQRSYGLLSRPIPAITSSITPKKEKRIKIWNSTVIVVCKQQEARYLAPQPFNLLHSLRWYHFINIICYSSFLIILSYKNNKIPLHLMNWRRFANNIFGYIFARLLLLPVRYFPFAYFSKRQHRGHRHGRPAWLPQDPEIDGKLIK